MAGEKDKFVIHLLIGKQLYPITVQRDQEGVYRKASQLINEKLARYEHSYPQLGNDRYMSAALLDFAVQSLQYQSLKDDSPYDEAVAQLSDEIRQLLEQE